MSPFPLLPEKLACTPAWAPACVGSVSSPILVCRTPWQNPIPICPCVDGILVLCPGYPRTPTNSSEAMCSSLEAARVWAGPPSWGRKPPCAVVRASSQSPQILPTFSSAMAAASVVVLGPGLGRGAWAQQGIRALASYDGPLVIDADGLYWLADTAQARTLKNRRAPLFLTPHAGEAARLLECSISEILNNPRQAVIDMTERFNATCLLKGPGTIIGTRMGQAICAHGNPGMASAGMGDVLAGLVGSLIAQQPSSPDLAFTAGVLLHSAAADQAAEKIGMRGLTASTIISHIAALLREERSD